MFNRTAYENSRPDGIPLLQIVPTIPSPEELLRQFVPLRQTELRGEVAGPLASLVLVQTFGYSREQCDQVLEAVYRFPLPGDAAVTGVRVRFGEVEIEAALKERGQAEQEYQEAKAQGRQAALTTREAPDVFTLQVAGLQPDQEITVETSYIQLARVEEGGWSLRVPLTTAPRFVRKDEEGSRAAQGQPLLLMRDPGHRFSLDLRLPAAGAVESPTHALQAEEDGDGLRVRLADGEVLPDRDCVLNWSPRAEREQPALQALLHEEREAGLLYFLALLTPPTGRPSQARVPREVLLLVDHSGSMTGPKWDAADWAVKTFLSGLSTEDTFNLGLFHDSTRWFRNVPVAATEEAVRNAIDFLEKHRDSGGTELGVALEKALHQQRSSGERARHVLIVTDAQVTDEGRILRLVEEEAKEAERRRISILCIDAAPNSFLAFQVAERGGGTAKFLTSSPEEEDISTALDAVLAEWDAPLLAGLHLEVDHSEVEPAGRDRLPSTEAGWSALDLGDLPAGRPVWVAGRVPLGASGQLAFRVTGSGRKVAAARVPLGVDGNDRPALKALFGARRVLGLEFLMQSRYSGRDLKDALRRLGYDPDTALKDVSGRQSIYDENQRAEAEQGLRGLLVQEALEYGLASAETAFIAVRKEAGKPVEGTVEVANALPSGWSEEFLTGGMPVPAGVASLASPARRSSTLSKMRMMAAPQVEADAFMLAEAEDIPRDALLAAPASFGEVTYTRSAGAGVVIFLGKPHLENGQAVLFDSSRPEDAGTLPEPASFTRLRVQFLARSPKSLDKDLLLLLFVGDMAAPRARVRLRDLLRQGGERPLNLSRGAGQGVQLQLADPSGVWASGAPEIEVTLR